MRMRNLLTVVLVAFLIGGVLTAPVDAASRKRIIPGSSITALIVGTDAVSDTSTAIDITDYSEIGITATITVTSGGSAGAGLYYIEGSIDGTVWTKVPVIDMTDTGMVRTDMAFASTASLQVSGIVVSGYTIADDSAYDGFFMGNYLPYKVLRIVVVDTNWNAAATFTFDWIVTQ